MLLFYNSYYALGVAIQLLVPGLIRPRCATHVFGVGTYTDVHPPNSVHIITPYFINTISNLYPRIPSDLTLRLSPRNFERICHLQHAHCHANIVLNYITSMLPPVPR